MKFKIFSAFICIIALLLSSAPIACFASGSTDKTAEAQSIIDGILSYLCSGDVQKWIDESLTQTVGDGSEWYVLALTQYGSYDFSRYEGELINYLKGGKTASASSKLKIALCLLSVGSTDVCIQSALNDSIGKQGLMSWVFALHLMNNGCQSNEYTANDVKSKLLELQCDDGGWAIMGQYGDADATALTVQSLAPYYENDEKIKSAIDKAVSFLSKSQLEDGNFASFGAANPESTCQVIAALSAIGIDAAADERFIKNGNGVFDGIGKYRLANGSFCHTLGGDTNGFATVQALCAGIAYLRFAEGRTPLYIFESKSDTPTSGDTSPETNSTEPSLKVEDTRQATEDKDFFGGYKLWACIITVIVGGVMCIILLILKKNSFKNFIAVLIMCAAAVTVICVTDIRSSDDYYSGDITKDNPIGTVTLTIRCDAVAGKAKHIPENGIILEKSTLEIGQGDTVYTVLTDAAREYKLSLESSGVGTYAYISGINYLYEFDYGELSGWVYTVNGQRPSVSIGEYKPSDGDIIEIHYTLTLGEDLK